MALSSTTVKKIAELAHLAPSADNSQAWKLVWNGEKLSIGYDFARATGKTFPADSPATLLSIGAVLENIIAVASDWNLDPKVEFCTELPASDGIYARIRFNGYDSNNTLIGEPHPVSRRHCNRLPYRKQPIPDVIVEQQLLLCEKHTNIRIYSNK